MFKAWDVVKILSTNNTLQYLSKYSIGEKLTLDSHDANNLNEWDNAHPEDNKYRANFKASDFKIVSKQTDDERPFN